MPNIDRAPRASVASTIMLGLIGPGVAAQPPDAMPKRTIQRGIGPAFRVALSRPDGPVIAGATGDLRSATMTGDPATGAFGPQITWPLVPIHAVLLPDGRVLTYGSDRNGNQTGFYDYDLWDPALADRQRAHRPCANGSATDLFCNTQTLLLDGNVEMYGGDNLPVEHADVQRSRRPVPTRRRQRSCVRER